MRENEPLLSVLIPVYNVESYLRECIDSVLNQSYDNLEVICVDDGSTDNSGLILDNYALLDSRLIVVHKENGGLVSARKEAIKRASGEYSVCVDSDDWIEPEMFKNMLWLAVDNVADVVTSGCYREYERGSSVDGDLFEPGVYKGLKLKKVFQSKMMEMEKGFQQNVKTTVWGKIYKTDLLRKYQMLVEDHINVGEDAAVVYPCLLNASCIVVSGRNYYHYRIRPRSVAVSKSKNEDISLRSIEEALKKEFLKHSEEIENAESQYKAIALFNRLVICPESVVKIQDGRVFPFGNVKESDRVIIYGAGRFGKKLYNVLKDAGIRIVALTDKNVSEGVVSFMSIKELEYDKIIIAVLKSNLIEEIMRFLASEEIEGSRIITIDAKTVTQ